MILIFGLLTSVYPIFLMKLNSKYYGLVRSIIFVLFIFLIFLLDNYFYLPIDSICLFLDGTIKMTEFNLLLQIIVITVALIIFQIGSSFSDRGEINLVMLINLIGIIYFLSAIEWLITIVAWELFNLSLYLLVSMNYGHNISSAIKYFLLSAYTTSFLLISISLLYGLTGTTNYENLVMINLTQDNNEFYFPLFLMLITFLFKLGMAPLHQWGPDLYDSLPTHLTLWMVTIPKIAVLFLLSQNTLFIYDQSGFTYKIMALFGIISLIIGSIGLGNQWKIKRFLAYSSISNLGFIILSYSITEIYIFYILIYIITTIIIFSILLSLKDIETIYDLAGIYHINPAISLALSICLFSLAGCPPLAGFFTKLLVIINLLEIAYYPITFIIILTSIISTCNYLSIIQIINIHPNDNIESNFSIQLHLSYFITASIGLILILMISLSFGPNFLGLSGLV